jgi:uncharacterized damage-inducible protein DinB
MNGPAIESLMRFNDFTIDSNLEGITEDESMSQPAGGGNCLNWVLGHIVATRHGALQLLGAKGIWSTAEIDRYKRGSQPVSTAAEAKPWEELRAAETRTRQILAEVLKGASQETLDAEVEDKTFGATVGANLLALQWHEGYHAGQLGVLRRTAGKAGALT